MSSPRVRHRLVLMVKQGLVQHGALDLVEVSRTRLDLVHIPEGGCPLASLPVVLAVIRLRVFLLDRLLLPFSRSCL